MFKVLTKLARDNFINRLNDTLQDLLRVVLYYYIFFGNCLLSQMLSSSNPVSKDIMKFLSCFPLNKVVLNENFSCPQPKEHHAVIWHFHNFGADIEVYLFNANLSADLNFDYRWWEFDELYDNHELGL